LANKKLSNLFKSESALSGANPSNSNSSKQLNKDNKILPKKDKDERFYE